MPPSRGRQPLSRIAERPGLVDLDLLLPITRLGMGAGQSKFGDTGGINASALFDFCGNLITIAGGCGASQWAIDKLVGECLLWRRLPPREHIILLSGRARISN